MFFSGGLRSNKKEVGKEVLIKNSVILVTIHPFEDGNGRTARKEFDHMNLALLLERMKIE